MSVSSLEIKEDRLIANGKEFGKSGQYREIMGIAKFSLDPNEDYNKKITDIEKIPLNEQGLIEYSSDFHIMIPNDISKSNRKIIYERREKIFNGWINWFFNYYFATYVFGFYWIQFRGSHSASGY